LSYGPANPSIKSGHEMERETRFELATLTLEG
jgi:hypothetical protein